MVKIIIKKNESSDSIIKRLKLNLIKNGLLKSIKNNFFYIKPKEKKKNKKLNKIKRIQKYFRSINFKRKLY